MFILKRARYLKITIIILGAPKYISALRNSRLTGSDYRTALREREPFLSPAGRPQIFLSMGDLFVAKHGQNEM
ncbi:hypothetical protein [Cereibacter sphaeroides]|uniref:hypothetical protein n=1 Tax=Cereibacter sphaeroides TaxID=1063 RepID=UPI001B35703D|nr:hypothetical protein [Cereibacter sphaeroides]